jgi:hypothetical protein
VMLRFGCWSQVPWAWMAADPLFHAIWRELRERLRIHAARVARSSPPGAEDHNPVGWKI